MAVTGRAMITAPDDVTDAEPATLGVDGFGQANDPRVMTRLTGLRGWVDELVASSSPRARGRRLPTQSHRTHASCRAPT